VPLCIIWVIKEGMAKREELMDLLDSPIIISSVIFMLEMNLFVENILIAYNISHTLRAKTANISSV
jgi:hypothetical protein